MGSQYRKIVIAAALLMLASGAAAKPKKAPPPPPPPPPPPIVVYIPPRPTPPLGASPLFKVPVVGIDGVRQSINTKIGPLQTVWNLRSAYNVAALNCQRVEHNDILIGYKRFLKIYKVGLLKANRGVDADYRKRFGPAYIRPREAYMTQVYNYYAFPPTLPNFCDAALAMARESMTLKPIDLTAFAQRYVPQFDLVYESFYRSYDQFRADAAAWDAKYAPVTLVVPVPVPFPVPSAGPGMAPGASPALPGPSGATPVLKPTVAATTTATPAPTAAATPTAAPAPAPAAKPAPTAAAMPTATPKPSLTPAPTPKPTATQAPSPEGR